MHLRQGIKPQRNARDTQQRSDDMVPEVFRLERAAAACHHKRNEDGAESSKEPRSSVQNFTKAPMMEKQAAAAIAHKDCFIVPRSLFVDHPKEPALRPGHTTAVRPEKRSDRRRVVFRSSSPPRSNDGR